MKKIQNTIIILALTLGIIGSANSQAFVKVGGKALDIAMSPKDGSVYVVNASRNVKKYSSSTKKFQVFGTQAKNAKSIAVHPNGSVYMVSSGNEAFIDVKGKWIKIPGLKIDEIDIDKSGNVRATDLAGKLYKLNGGKWQPISNVNFNTTGFNQVVALDSRILFARFKDNTFKTFNGSIWKTLNGKPLKITVDDKTGKVYAVGRNKGIYQWFDNTQKWVLIKNTRKDLKDVAVNNGKIWAIGLDKSIYYYGNKGFDFDGTYRVTYTRFIDKYDYRFPYEEFFGAMGVYVSSKTKSGDISIKPKGNKKNRIWDVSKGYPIKVRKKSGKLNNDRFINGSNTSGFFTYDREWEIGKSREFIIAGEAANTSAKFDFQMNVKQKRPLNIEIGGYQRQIINIADLKLDYEYFFTHKSGVRIGFKIEKL
ncbi:MAG: hypothetical protein AAF688_00900 [Bacteroidota bacterium]